MIWETELEDKLPLENNKVWIGKVRDPLASFRDFKKPNLSSRLPIMPRLSFCILSGLGERELYDF